MSLVVKSDHFCKNVEILALIGGWLPVYQCKLGLNHFECYKCEFFEGNNFYKEMCKKYN